MERTTNTGAVPRRQGWAWPAAFGCVLVLSVVAAVLVSAAPRDMPGSVWLPPDFRSGDHPFTDPTGKERLEHIVVERDSNFRDLIRVQPASPAVREVHRALAWIRDLCGVAQPLVDNTRWLDGEGAAVASRQEWVESMELSVRSQERDREWEERDREWEERVRKLDEEWVRFRRLNPLGCQRPAPCGMSAIDDALGPR